MPLCRKRTETESFLQYLLVLVQHIGVSRRGQKGHGPQFLEHIVILCFKRRFSKQNYSPKIKHFGPPNFLAGYATGPATKGCTCNSDFESCRFKQTAKKFQVKDKIVESQRI